MHACIINYHACKGVGHEHSGSQLTCAHGAAVQWRHLLAEASHAASCSTAGLTSVHAHLAMGVATLGSHRLLRCAPPPHTPTRHNNFAPADPLTMYIRMPSKWVWNTSPYRMNLFSAGGKPGQGQLPCDHSRWAWRGRQKLAESLASYT